MTRPRRRLRSDLAYSTPDRIVVRGLDLADMIGHVSLGDFAFLELKGRLPTEQESAVFNAITITLVEHGVTPSAMAARLTYHGAPESLQGAVAAGLLGMGDRYGGPVGDVARMLQEALILEARASLEEVARDVVAALRSAPRPVPGVGHPLHRVADPRVAPLFRVAAENGFSGRYVRLMELISAEATRATGRELPVNATGAIGAIASELGLSWGVCRGLAVMARAIGLVAHVQEEIERPMAAELWARTEAEASEHLRGS
jgi:citrate synthase